MQLHRQELVPAGQRRGDDLGRELGLAQAASEGSAHQADGSRDVGGGDVDVTRAVGGVVLAGAEQVGGELVAGVHAQHASQPDGEEAAALGQVLFVRATLPTQHGGRLRHGQEVVISADDHLVGSRQQRLDGA